FSSCLYFLSSSLSLFFSFFLSLSLAHKYYVLRNHVFGCTRHFLLRYMSSYSDLCVCVCVCVCVCGVANLAEMVVKQKSLHSRLLIGYNIARHFNSQHHWYFFITHRFLYSIRDASLALLCLPVS